MNILDQIISYFSPAAGLKRAQHRIALTQMRRYEAAAHGRRTQDWKAGTTSANQETELALTTLRNRSRDLDRNNPYANRAFNVIANNTVGTGIKPSPADGNTKVKEAWKTYAKNCHHEKSLTFYGIQWLVMRTVALSGECLIRRRNTTDSKAQFKLQVLEPDFLDSSKTLIGYDGEGNYDVQGVRFNKAGERTGYWLYDKHPSEFGEVQSTLVPAKDILHIYLELRPGQVRGVPFFTPAALRLKNFDEYEDAQLVRQQIAACFSVFITDIETPASTSTTPNLEQVQPGIVEYLPPGKSVEFANPPGVDGFDKYSRQVLTAIAAGIGVTYEAMTGDLSNVNFSSGRMGWLEFARNVGNWQEMLITKLNDPVWSWFMEALQIQGATPTEASWTTPRREMIDPVAETKGLSEQVRNLFVPWEDAVKSIGNDPEQVLEQSIRTAKAFDDAGLMPTCDPRFDSNRAVPKDGADGEDSPDDSEDTPSESAAK
jgi:lambda family phage portal protein